jgi:hypothetical protein
MVFPRFTNLTFLALLIFSIRLLSLLAEKVESFIKNSVLFVQLLKSVNPHSSDTFFGFDISRFTNVPVSEALQVISNKLHNNDTLVGWPVLHVEAIVELLGVCLRLYEMGSPVT